MAFDKEKQVQITRRVATVFDWRTFFVALLLITVGLISVYSATFVYSTTYDSGMSPIFIRQALAAGIGLLLMIVLMFIPERWIALLTYPVYGVSIFLLILVFFIGKTSYGTQGWIYLGGLSIQPSEIAKVTSLIAAALYLSRKGANVQTLRDLAAVIGLFGLPALLIARQPDFGTATVFAGMLLGVLFWSGFNSFLIYLVLCYPILIMASLFGLTSSIIATFLATVAALFFRRRLIFTFLAIASFVGIGFATPLIINNLQEHQKHRIETFLNPEKDPLGKAYNVIQSKMAVGSGGIIGKGFLHGTQTQLRYIPKQWTDFIFSVPSEEFGFLGSFLVLMLIGTLILRAVVVAYDTNLKFYSIIAIGIATQLFYHTVINIGMAIGLVPVMGIPLPFMSAGGTAMIVNCVMVGFLLNIYRHKKQKRF